MCGNKPLEIPYRIKHSINSLLRIWSNCPNLAGFVSNPAVMISCYKLFFEHIWWGAAVALSSFRKQPSVKIGNSRVFVRERCLWWAFHLPDWNFDGKHPGLWKGNVFLVISWSMLWHFSRGRLDPPAGFQFVQHSPVIHWSLFSINRDCVG